MKFYRHLSVLLSVAISTTMLPSHATSRERLNFDRDWQFHRGDIAIKLAVKAGMQGGLSDTNAPFAEGEHTKIAYTDRNKTIPYNPDDWENVTIPHDWMVNAPFIYDNNLGSQYGSNGYKPSGKGFYRKTFVIPKEDEGKRLTLEFDGIFRNSTVWVNGHIMGGLQSGYLPSFYDITDVARYGDEGENVVLVRVDATDYEGWWYEGAGIYRHTWLTKTDPLHIDRFGIFVTTPDISEAKATVNVNTTVRNNHEREQHYQVHSNVIDKKGNIVGKAISDMSTSGNGTSSSNHDIFVDNPELWSPEHPYLYTLRTSVIAGSDTIDRSDIKFGIRKMGLTTNGFLLNGKPYPIKGTCNHQDHAGVGVAMPDKIIEYRLQLLKEMGSNGYRCAHHPPTPELLDICDSLGMLVLDENRHLYSSEQGLKDLETLVLRDRNHPCVIGWNLENEENLEGTKMGARILRTLHNKVKQLDPTRFTTAAINHGWNDGGYIDIIDVAGYNYGQRGMQYVKDKEKYPNRRMLATESTSFVATRGEFEDNEEKGYMSNFGKGVSWGLQPGEDWKHIVDYPYLSGTFVWTGFDYRGEPTPYLWPCINSHFGIMDMCGFPKDGYYAYKAAWTDTPVVHAYPHWNLKGKEGQEIRMGVYTNCEEVEMIVNGKNLGRKKATPYVRLEWTAVYHPGRMEVRGYNGKKLVTREVTETTGDPSRIELAANTTDVKANGTDIIIVNVALKDKKGRIVPTACNTVNFEVYGNARLIGVGNGDPSCHEADVANSRSAFNGLCQVILQTTDDPGDITLDVTSVGLQAATLKLRSK